MFAITPRRAIRWKPGMAKSMLSPKGNKEVEILRRYFKKSAQSLFGRRVVEKAKAIYELRKMTHDLVRHWVPSDITVSTYCMTAYAGYILAERSVPLYHMQHFEEVFFSDMTARLLARNTYNLPLFSIANSSWLQNIIQGFFNKQAYVLNPGIDTDVFKVYADPGSKYIDKKEWTIASYVDETREWKGFGDAAATIKQVRQCLQTKGISVRWKLFGLNPPGDTYGTDFEYCGKIFGADLARFYSKADIVFLPSWYESFPLPPIEAMASGTLVVTTRYGTEDYAFDGINSLVCIPRDIDQMAQKIIYAINNPDISLRMVKKALDTVLMYTWDKRTDALEDIMNEASKEYNIDRYRFFNDLASGRFSEYMHDIFNLDATSTIE